MSVNTPGKTFFAGKVPVRVLKFGGSSVGDAQSIRRVAEIVRKATRRRRIIVVVSALARVTNTLEQIILDRRTDRAALLLTLYRRHVDTARELLSPDELARYRSSLGDQLAVILPSLRRLRRGEQTRFDEEAVLAAGERFSVPLVAACLRDSGLDAVPVDGATLIRKAVDECDSETPGVDGRRTDDLIRSWYAELPSDRVPVVSGYVASSDCGHTVTLGRGGSDYSASLIASALGADLLERWTSVDGLYTGDPGTDRFAARYRLLRLDDAEVLNRSGGLGMHRHTIAPLISSRIPLRVRSFDSTDPGTLVIPSTSTTTC